MGIALCIVLVPHRALYAGDFGNTCSFDVNGYQMKYTHLCWENCGKINRINLVCNICPITGCPMALIPIGKKYGVKVMQTESVKLGLKYLPQAWR